MFKQVYDKLDTSCPTFFSLPDEAENAPFDDQSAAVIRLNNSTILYMKEINKVLALVCILREENFTKPGKLRENFVKSFKFQKY